MPELTTVSAVQAYLGDTSISSGVLTTYINAAETEIARRCNRYDDTDQGNHWLTHARVEYIDGECAEYVNLKFTPVSALSSCVVVLSSGSTQTITTTNLTLDGREIADLSSTTPGRFGKLAWRWGSRPSLYNFDVGGPFYGQVDLGVYGMWTGFGGGPQRVKVTYTGGFQTAPADLVMAATQLAAQMYREKDSDPNVKSETLGDFSQTFIDGLAADTLSRMGTFQTIIANYGRPVF